MKRSARRRMMKLEPRLTERIVDGVRLLVDEGARRRGLLVAFTGREGGVSRAPFDSLNLAARVGDEREAVAENRKRVAAAAGFDSGDLALARQVHGADLIEVSPGEAGVLGQADGLVARAAGPVLGILTADCAPVLVQGGRGVAVLHAGWRGMVAGVVERGLDAVGPVDAAWIGPSIRACCYEVGPEVVAAFESRALPVASSRRVDPADAAASVLRRAGVERVCVAESCTACDRRYFSYRRDGVTGRQGAFLARLKPGTEDAGT